MLIYTCLKNKKWKHQE